MCGIAGFLGTGTKAELEAMTLAVKHRGPDDFGIFHENGIGLGHTRLSILDLSSAGHQPMFDNSKSLGLVFNGEIYNFKSIRKDLEKTGTKFKSNSDTEVIIELYKRDGVAAFSKLEGMFAIAIYDFKKSELCLARDRMGKKPLFYFIKNETIVFASELKSLTKHQLFKPELDVLSVAKFFAYDYVPAPRTIYQGVNKLPPATYAIYKNGAIQIDKFWFPDFATQSGTFKDHLSGLEQVLIKATKNRLVSDVPLGVFLSGGLDSSTIAYYASRISKTPIKTFSIAFNESSFDESVYARAVAKHLKTEHFEYLVTPDHLLKLIPKLGEMLDEPLADASIIPTLALSEFTKKEITVALSGDGSDELLAGYPTFQADKIFSIYKNIPPNFRQNSIDRLIRALPSSDKNFSISFKTKKFLDGVTENELYRHHAWLSAWNKADEQKLFSPAFVKKLGEINLFDELEDYSKEAKTHDINQTRLYLYQRTYLMDGVLVKVDRASMHSGLEVRSPFLDREVVDFINRLPYHDKLRGFQTKYILKKLMADKLPKNIIHRTKKGFGLPLTKWLREDLRDWTESILNKENIEAGGIFNYEYIAKLLKEHQSGAIDHRKKLWSIIVFELWRQNWLA